MADEPRIQPLDPDTVEGALKDTVANQRRLWGKALQPYLLYGRSDAVLKGISAMWPAIHSMQRIDARLKVLVNRRVAWWNGCPF
jgi:hypothetical protein